MVLDRNDGSAPVTVPEATDFSRVGDRFIQQTRTEKVSRRIARLVARHIAEQHLQPGTSLPAEQLMAQQLGVGRSSIREALRILEAQGLITIRPGLGGGPIVASPDGRDFGETMTMFLQVLGTPFRQIMDAVVTMEGVAAAGAATRVARGEVVEIEGLVAAGGLDIEDRVTDAAFISAATGFHDLVRDIGGNDILSLFGEAVGHIFRERALVLRNHHWDAEQRRVIRADHIRIATAIKSGKPAKARQLAEEHMATISEGVERLFPLLPEEPVDWR